MEWKVDFTKQLCVIHKKHKSHSTYAQRIEDKKTKPILNTFISTTNIEDISTSNTSNIINITQDTGHFTTYSRSTSPRSILRSAPETMIQGDVQSVGAITNLGVYYGCLHYYTYGNGSQYGGGSQDGQRYTHLASGLCSIHRTHRRISHNAVIHPTSILGILAYTPLRHFGHARQMCRSATNLVYDHWR